MSNGDSVAHRLPSSAWAIGRPTQNQSKTTIGPIVSVAPARRAEAMTIRDRASRRQVGVLDDDWDRIEAVLWVAWKALADEVRTVRDAEATEA